MTEPIKPATDQDILSVAGQHPGMGPRLIARTNADRATIAELLAALESAEAFIARTSGGGETDFRAGLLAVILRAWGRKPEEAA